MNVWMGSFLIMILICVMLDVQFLLISMEILISDDVYISARKGHSLMISRDNA